MSQTQNILIFGATGLIGKYITEQLIQAREDGHFKSIAIFTSQGTVDSKKDEIDRLRSRGVKVIVGDVTNEDDVKKAYDGVDTIISAVGRNVIAAQIDLLRWAESTPSIKKFFPSEYGTDIEYSPASTDEKPHQQKLKVRKFIKDEIKRLAITYLVTGPYSELYFGKAGGSEGVGTFDVTAKNAVILGDGRGRVSFTSMKDVGVLLVASLIHPGNERVSVLKVNSFTTTPEEIVREFERQTGEKWKVGHTSLEELRKGEKEAWEKGDPMATLWTLKRIWTEGGTLYDERDNARIGEPRMETLEEQVGKAIEKQRRAGL